MRSGRHKTETKLLREFLENYTVPLLKKLAGLTTSRVPTRKAELVDVIQKYLEDPQSCGKHGT